MEDMIENQTGGAYILDRVNRYLAGRPTASHLKDEMVQQAWLKMAEHEVEHGARAFNNWMDIKIKRACQEVEVTFGNTWAAMNGQAPSPDVIHPDQWRSKDGDFDGWEYYVDPLPTVGAHEQYSDAVAAGLDTLTERQSVALTCYAQGMGQTEIAAAYPDLFASRTYVQQALRDARKKMTKALLGHVE